MADNIIDLGYYAIISVFSTWLYYDRLSRRKGSLVHRRMLLAAVLIFLSHLLMFIPATDGTETILFIVQIIFEFYVVVWMFDEKIINKLIAYIEVNVAIGIGMTVGYVMLKANMGSEDTFTEIGVIEKLLFYIIILTITGVICFVLSYVDRRKDKVDNMKGIEASVVICIALLCVMYAVGMTMVEFKDNWKLWVVYGYFAIMTVMVMLLLYLNKRVQQSEDINIKYQVLKTIDENMTELEKELKAEKEYYHNKKSWLENSIKEIYDGMDLAVEKIIKTLVADKVSRAGKSGIDVQYDLEFEAVTTMSVYDVISIYSNLLDNAIRATSQNEHKEKIIKLKGVVSDSKFYLLLENPYETAIIEEDGEYVTTKHDKKQHGLGIKNVKSIAEKYNMTVEINTDNDMFRVVVQNNDRR